MNKVEGLLKVKASAPFWYFLCAIALPLLLAVLYFKSGLYDDKSEFEPYEIPVLSAPSQTTDVVTVVGSKGGSPKENIVTVFGIVACSFCFVISAFVLVFSLPIYLNSEHHDKSNRAGALVKTCLYFITGSASGILVAIGLG